MSANSFSVRYGAWALVAGASEGLGAAYARALASRGMNLLLVARRKALLNVLVDELHRNFGVEARGLEADLGAPDFVEKIEEAAAGLDLGLVVYNAAYAPMGRFPEMDSSDLSRVIDVNVRAPMLLARAVLPAMAAKGRGALILMSSLAGNQGSPGIAAYAASKAFNKVLAESLWGELRPRGVDVLVCTAGAILTPNYKSSSSKPAPGAVTPELVAESALRSLGRGPVVVPGFVSRLAAVFMGRLLPKRAAIGIMGGSTNALTPTPKPGTAP